MRSLILFALVLSAPAYAARGWWGRACDVLLLSRSAEVAPPPSILKIESEMQHELYRVNRTTQNNVTIHHTPLDFCNNRPLSVEMLPQLSTEYDLVRRVDMRLFVNPEAITLDWNDEGKDLAVGPSLVMMFDETHVHSESGETTLVGLVQEEFNAILARNPGIHAKLIVQRASELKDMRIRPEYKNHMVAWVEGKIPNYQVKRFMILTMDYAFSNAMMDQRYATKKPQKQPTRH